MAAERHVKHAEHVLGCGGQGAADQIQAHRENSEIAGKNDRCSASDFRRALSNGVNGQSTVVERVR